MSHAVKYGTLQQRVRTVRCPVKMQLLTQIIQTSQLLDLFCKLSNFRRPYLWKLFGINFFL